MSWAALGCTWLQMVGVLGCAPVGSGIAVLVYWVFWAALWLQSAARLDGGCPGMPPGMPLGCPGMPLGCPPGEAQVSWAALGCTWLHMVGVLGCAPVGSGLAVLVYWVSWAALGCAGLAVLVYWVSWAAPRWASGPGILGVLGCLWAVRWKPADGLTRTSGRHITRWRDHAKENAPWQP